MSRNYQLIVAPWKFDVLKTSIFALEASLLGQVFVLRTSNFRGATELARAVDVMMARAKRIYILIITVNRFFPFIRRSVSRNRKHVLRVSIELNRDTSQNLGELEKAVETLAYGSCSHSFLRSPKLPLLFLFNS